MKLSLKTQNRPSVIIYSLFLGVLIWWTIKGSIDLPDILTASEYQSTALVAGLSGIVSLLISELIPAKVKLHLVYWRRKNPAPGSRAFSEIMHLDHRIDPKVLERRFGPLPTDPAEQDRKWYQIYKPLDGNIGVDDPHKSYLLFRELTVSTVVLGLVGTVLAIIFASNLVHVLAFSGTMVLFFCAMAIAAQNAGKRLVSNTLAIASAAKD